MGATPSICLTLRKTAEIRYQRRRRGAKRQDTLTVFLSYEREDEQRAQAFVKALESRGFSVWWDRLIGGGDAYADRIQSALTESDAVLVLWSDSSTKSFRL